MVEFKVRNKKNNKNKDVTKSKLVLSLFNILDSENNFGTEIIPKKITKNIKNTKILEWENHDKP